MSPKIVVGVDPGRTTGWCVVNYEDSTAGTLCRILSFGLSKDPTELFQDLSGIVKERDVESIVLEDVVITGKLNKAKFDQIGAMHSSYLAVTENGYSYEKISYVPPGTRKILGDRVPIPEELKGKSKHIQDAFRLAETHRILSEE